MRTSGTISRVFAGVLFASLWSILLVSCSNDDEKDNNAITGQVIDSDSLPVPAAHIAIDFRLADDSELFGKVAVVTTLKPYPADISDSSCNYIFDWCGELLTTIKCIGDELCIWDGTQLGVLNASPGLYTIERRDCETGITAQVDTVLLIRTDLEDELNDMLIPLATTDFQGRFAIPRCLVPTGVQFGCVPEGEPAVCEVDPFVLVYAWKDDKQGLERITIPDRGTVEVTIQLSGK